MYTGTTMEFKVDSTEYVYNTVAVSAYRPTSMKVYVPKLMAGFAKASPSTNKLSINKNIFCNDTTCAVSPGTLLTTQNFITITRFGNIRPSFINVSSGSLPAFSKILANVPNGDIRNIRFTGDV